MIEEKLFQEIEHLKQEVASLKASRGPRAFFRRALSKSSLILGVIIAAVLTGFLGWAVQNTFVDGTVISADAVNNNFNELYAAKWGVNGSDYYYNGGNVGIGTDAPVSSLDVNGQITARSVTSNYCYSYYANASSFTIYGTTWADISGFSTCQISTYGRPLKITIDFSVYASELHGGIRLLMDGTTPIGANSTYGLDWVVPTANVWIKRNIIRVISGIPAGTHTFMVQARSQTSGGYIQFQGGDISTNYSGVHLIIEEL